MDNNDFPPPETLFLELPAGIRCELLERTAQAIQSGADAFKAPNLSGMPFNARIDFIVNTIELGKDIAAPYRKAAYEINKQLHETFSEGQRLEKEGEIQQAVNSYEQSITNGFLGSLPYERLRIIYTKQKQYEKAIQACKRYVEILKMVDTFWPQYPNIRLIPKYQKEIVDLSSKTKSIK